jgi:hypothetical protein
MGEGYEDKEIFLKTAYNRHSHIPYWGYFCGYAGCPWLDDLIIPYLDYPSIPYKSIQQK